MIKPLLSFGQKIRAIISLLAAIILLLGYYFCLFSPALAAMHAAEAALELEKSRPPAEESAAAIEELKYKKRELDDIFKREKNIPPLSRTIKNLARQYNLDLRNSLKIKTEQQGRFVKAQCTLTAVGEGDGISDFLLALVQAGCLIRRADIAQTSAASAQGESVMKLSVSLLYYRCNK